MCLSPSRKSRGLCGSGVVSGGGQSGGRWLSVQRARGVGSYLEVIPTVLECFWRAVS